ncbi:MAG: dihydrodipicolinate synthase family protein [Oscillospiraceae bacterium]|jgi:dihydrodipicolinate synthase/N-acetylneuraminate lyase|nr:dihydrodipicolinate synthase family protein [Oscillospiraceae bacterium]
MCEKPLFQGAASEVITPFTEGGDIDFELLAAEVDYLVERGITGLFVNGLASEALMFSQGDRAAVLKKCVEIAAGRIPVSANIICNSVDMATEYLREYESCGCDAVVVTPPLVYKYTEEGLFRYFDGIAGATRLPVYLYNAPETGNKLSPELIARLVAARSNLRGYKDSTQDIIHQQTVLGLIEKDRHFELLAGSDAQILTTCMLGGVGVFSLLTCVFPNLIVGICRAIAERDWESAKDLQQKILLVRQAMKIGPFMAAYKYVGKLTGHSFGSMRYPLSELSEKEKQAVTARLEELCMLPA